MPYVDIVAADQVDAFARGDLPILPAGHRLWPHDNIAIIGSSAIFGSEIRIQDPGGTMEGVQFIVSADFGGNGTQVVLSDISKSGTALAAGGYTILH